MGFWHTGYFEHHAQEGWDEPYVPPPETFPCIDCGLIFPGIQELRQHRFQTHALLRPQLFVDGKEVGTQTLHIARKLRAAQVVAIGADRALLDGQELDVTDLPPKLAESSSGMHIIVLQARELAQRFKVEFRIATHEDMDGVERSLRALIRKRRLDGRAVEEFIDASSEFRTAIGYCDGITAYLYGVLAKERAKGISVPYEQYSHKLNLASCALGVYERRLARMLRALIAFQFNQFRESQSLLSDSRVGKVARRYGNWIERDGAATGVSHCLLDVQPIESALTELDTERLLGWGSQPMDSLCDHVEQIEEMIVRGRNAPDASQGAFPVASLDEPKLHVLLGELYMSCGQRKKAIEHARMARNQPYFDQWATRILENP